MKKIAFVMMLSVAAWAGEWKGVISDSKCGKAHADASEKSMKCVQGCVKGGKEAVFVSEDGKVLKIHNQDAVKEHLGHKVTVMGNIDGESIHIDSVKM
ncbi:MAG: hypothetical protein HYR60_09235 [Acidobacteria bacterium]|nr:hypothetical protein [Acidobacteriota bacterium]MBI3473387.1 hypothetical protein [Candidatus Solibacter usitatus]